MSYERDYEFEREEYQRRIDAGGPYDDDEGVEEFNEWEIDED